MLAAVLGFGLASGWFGFASAFFFSGASAFGAATGVSLAEAGVNVPGAGERADGLRVNPAAALTVFGLVLASAFGSALAVSVSV